MNKQKGFVGVLLLIIVAIGVTGGAYYLSKNYSAQEIARTSPSPTPEVIQESLTPQKPSPTVSTPTPTAKPTLQPITHEISIIGDEICRSKTNGALNLLKNKASIHYEVFVKYVGTIECAQSGSGIYVWEKPPRFKVGNETRDYSAIWYAGVLAHESCHSKQYNDWLAANTSSEVPDDVFSGKIAEAQCSIVQYDALADLGAGQYELDWVKNSINLEYWNIDYKDRWW